jgi:hypothetical protein
MADTQPRAVAPRVPLFLTLALFCRSLQPRFPLTLVLMRSLFKRLLLARLPLTLALVLQLFRCLPLTRFAFAQALKLTSMFKALVIRAASAGAFLDARFDARNAHLDAPFEKCL